MKLGIFDSGLGGLLITKSIRSALPDIDIVYVGDTLHLPYGNRSKEAVYMYTCRAMEHMFSLGCKLIVIACNTASAAALRKLQQEWLPQNYPDRNILGVVVPTLETAIEKGFKRLGLIGTNYIVHSGIYEDELVKISPDIRMTAKATPLLVPLIEHDGLIWAEDVLDYYLSPFLKDKIQCLLLGCTHYPYLKPQIRKILGRKIKLLSQDDIIPGKLSDYLQRHPEYSEAITQNGVLDVLVSDLTESYCKAARALYGEDISIRKTVF